MYLNCIIRLYSPEKFTISCNVLNQNLMNTYLDMQLRYIHRDFLFLCIHYNVLQIGSVFVGVIFVMQKKRFFVCNLVRFTSVTNCRCPNVSPFYWLYFPIQIMIYYTMRKLHDIAFQNFPRKTKRVILKS